MEVLHLEETWGEGIAWPEQHGRAKTRLEDLVLASSEVLLIEERVMTLEQRVVCYSSLSESKGSFWYIFD